MADRVRLDTLRVGDRFRWCGTLFELAGADPSLDRIPMLAVRYLEGVRGATIRGHAGLMPAHELVEPTDDAPPWLPDLLDALGWQGGTIHEAIAEVRRRRALMDACHDWIFDRGHNPHCRSRHTGVREDCDCEWLELVVALGDDEGSER